MRTLIQRVDGASVNVGSQITGKIKGLGLLILLGVAKEDTEKDINYLVRKILNLRIFNDEHGIMNLSIQDIKGEILVISQFTLYADTRKGNRPSYDKAAGQEQAKLLYDKFVSEIIKSGLKVEEGVFGANMQVNLTNTGPVTMMLESK
ncbi:MAG: D-aminoacyl-tRNA deacylase [Thermodesulfobacteriota bacterium]